MKISISLTTINYFDIQKNIKRINLSNVDMIHFDVMDGVFVPNITYGMDFVKAIRPHSQKFFDVHLMLLNPLPYIDGFVNAGADMIKVHVEANNTLKSLKKIKSLGIKCGIVINPETEIGSIKKYLGVVDEILIMSVNPGFGGQKFMSLSFDKVQILMTVLKKQNSKITVQVDGGITFDIAKKLSVMGVDSIVMGKFLFSNKNFFKAVGDLKKL